MEYKKLTKEEKALFNKIEGFFIDYKVISRKMFVKILAILINKYRGNKK